MVKCRILCSKRLSKSFKKIESLDTWESIVFEIDEAQEIVTAALRKLTEHSEPLTITITTIEKNEKSIHS